MRTNSLTAALAGALTIGIVVSAAAQNQSGPAKQEDAKTPIQQGEQSGTAPGNAGNTGWTNGIGGTFVGTSNQNPTRGSSTEHPETAKGLDPTKDKAKN